MISVARMIVEERESTIPTYHYDVIIEVLLVEAANMNEIVQDPSIHHTVSLVTSPYLSLISRVVGSNS